jgi:hypothetical protein
MMADSPWLKRFSLVSAPVPTLVETSSMDASAVIAELVPMSIVPAVTGTSKPA